MIFFIFHFLKKTLEPSEKHSLLCFPQLSGCAATDVGHCTLNGDSSLTIGSLSDVISYWLIPLLPL